MKEMILKKPRAVERPELQQLLLREQLQHLLLQEMDRMELFNQICFVGGTALRILYDLRRFSEDLDFSARDAMTAKTDFSVMLKTLQKKITEIGLKSAEMKLTATRAAVSTLLSFPYLLHELNPRAFRKTQLLSIKIEIDSNPPQGAREAVSATSGERLYTIRHYDLPSLFASKLHAILLRNYTKGRDLYDFIWYTSRRTPVNQTLLQNAITQTKKEKTILSDETLRALLKQRANELNFAQAKKEIARFLEDPRESELINKDLFVSQIAKVCFE